MRNTSRPLFLYVSLCVVLCLGLRGLRAEEIVERFPDNQTVRLKYSRDKDGRKQGPYVENDEKGAPRLRAVYKDDKLNGAYTERWPSGVAKITANYKNGVLAGEYVVRDKTGAVKFSVFYRSEKEKSPVHPLSYPKTLEEIRATAKKLIAETAPEKTFEKEPSTDSPHQAGRLTKESMEHALNRLKFYRYLCEVPYADLTDDAVYSDQAQHGATLLKIIGGLGHEPPRPDGVAKEFYDKALEGTMHGNLAYGTRDLAEAVDQWMDDSDDSNIDRVGHRRWLLNPAMLKTGWGWCDPYAVVWAHDESRKSAPTTDALFFPARGYHPAAFFKPGYAWSVMLPAKFLASGGDAALRVSVCEFNADFDRSKPLVVDHVNVAGFLGEDKFLTVIFRPDLGDAPLAGRKFIVELFLGKAKTPFLQYITEFVDLTENQ